MKRYDAFLIFCGLLASSMIASVLADYDMPGTWNINITTLSINTSGNPFDQWLNTTSDVTFVNLNTTGNLTVDGHGTFSGDFNKSIKRGGSVTLGGYDGGFISKYGTIVIETDSTPAGGYHTSWCIDNAGNNIRIYDCDAGYAKFRINETHVIIGESYYGREVDWVITGDTYAEGNVEIAGTLMAEDGIYMRKNTTSIPCNATIDGMISYLSTATGDKYFACNTTDWFVFWE